MARIIRGARIIPREIVDAQTQAEEIVRDAEARAGAIVAEERARIEAEARAAAHLEVEGARRARLEEIEAVVATLAVQIARRLVSDAVATDPNRVRELVRDALGRVRRASVVRVRVCPGDAPRLDGVDAEVVVDESLSPGDCVVESDLGDVDARMEVRLERIAAALASGTSG